MLPDLAYWKGQRPKERATDRRHAAVVRWRGRCGAGLGRKARIPRHRHRGFSPRRVRHARFPEVNPCGKLGAGKSPLTGRHPRDDPCEDVGVGVVECGLKNAVAMPGARWVVREPIESDELTARMALNTIRSAAAAADAALSTNPALYAAARRASPRNEFMQRKHVM